jgi:5-methylcytosine-specific restriction endonuclease McrA
MRLDPITGLKTCNRCRAPKPPDKYSKNAKQPDGLNSQCKECHKQYYEANKESYKRRAETYYKANKESYKRHDKTYYEENKERIKQYVKDNPHVKKASDHKRRALRVSSSDGTVTSKALLEMLMTWSGICPRCGREADSTIDHIVPLSKGGAHSITNLQLLCKSCNGSKHAKVE